MGILTSTLTLPDEALMEVTPNLGYAKIHSGKVRDIFDLGPYLLLIATDRISVYDQSFTSGIPGRGILLTQMSLLFFEHTKDLCTNHIAPLHSTLLQKYLGAHPELIPRAMVVKKCTPLPIEAIARGYLAGNAWLNYQKTGQVFGLPVPGNLKEWDSFPQALFTPSTKSKVTDIPLSEKEAQDKIGSSLYQQIKPITLKIYAWGHAYAHKRGLVLVDTKLEFGLDEQSRLTLIDEILTPDSSRYWTEESYKKGKPKAFDKQFLRDYVRGLGWKTGPLPLLPEGVIKETQERFLTAWRLLSSS